MEQELEQLKQEWQAQRKELLDKCAELMRLRAEIFEVRKELIEKINEIDRRFGNNEKFPDYAVATRLIPYIEMYFTVDPGNKEMYSTTESIIKYLREKKISFNKNPRTAGRELAQALYSLGLERKMLVIKGTKARGWVGVEVKK